jgi:hypothetical protein
VHPKKGFNLLQHQKKNRTIVDQYGQEHGKAIYSLMGKLDVVYNGYSAGMVTRKILPYLLFHIFEIREL